MRSNRLYRSGTKIKVISINDPYINVPVGIIGKIVHVDNDGRIFVSLGNDRIFSLNLNKDKIVIEKSSV